MNRRFYKISPVVVWTEAESLVEVQLELSLCLPEQYLKSNK